MKHRGIALVVAAAATLAGAAAHTVGAAASSPRDAARGAVANGSGDTQRTFTFNVAAAPAGGVTGQAQVINRETGAVAHATLTCLVISGDIAYVGGTIDSSNRAGLIGAPMVFAVQDNGGVAADEITGLSVGSADCTDPGNQSDLQIGLFPVDRGGVFVGQIG